MDRPDVRLGGLNDAQRRAVRQIDGPVLILAGAGSGKTRVITSRIAWLLAQKVAPDKILAVTFTNKAANEMRIRVGTMVPASVVKELTISTFHSLCVKLLRGGIERLGYKSNFTIYTSSDQIGLLRQIITRKAGREEKLDAHLVQSLISRWKNRGIPVGANGDDLAADVAREYQRQLKLHNAVDFDDLLGLATDILENHADLRSQWQVRFHYLMVDEFQDTNRQQMQLLRSLAGSRQNVCVVGDDDQSIYGWRGAEISNILEFEKYFPNPAVIKLEENYRSQAPILQTANAIIRHNGGRRDKQLIAVKPGENPVRLIMMPGDKEEADFIVNEIWEANTIRRTAWEEFAILFRTNAQSRPFEEALRNQGIPYRLLGGQSFFERREVKDVLAYLHVALNADDDVNLLRIINNPPRGIGETTVGIATAASIERKSSIFATLADPAFAAQFSGKTKAAVHQFVDQVRGWRDALKRPGANHALLAEGILDQAGYIDYLKRHCPTPEDQMARESNVREFIESIRHHHASGNGGLREFLDSVSLDDEFQRESEKDKAAKRPGVWLITLHAAKGLEFPHVYLAGLEEGILPHRRSLEEGTRDEERRLLYVGITRAMESLTLTHCHSRVRYGQAMPVMPSGFIKELPSPPVEHLSHAEIVARPASVESAKSHFANIRAMLAKS